MLGLSSRLTYNQMVVHVLSDAEVDRIFGALADATRRDIVTQVLQREQSVTSLAQRYAMSFAAVQKHVAVLARARLVTKERHGRQQIVRGDAATVREAVRLLDGYEEIWRHRTDRIEQLLSGD